MRRLFYIAIVFLVFGCEKQIHLDEFEFDKKLVLNSFNELDSGIRINLSESVNVLDIPEYHGLSGDAYIKISSGNDVLVSENAYITNGQFQVFPTTKPGKQYSLEVEMEGFPSIKATDVVPLHVPMIQIDNAYKIGSSYKFKFTINDNADKEFYLINAYVVGLEVDGQDSSEAIYPVRFTSPEKIFVTNIGTVTNENEFALFNDELFNNSIQTIELAVDEAQFYHPNFQRDRLKVIVKSVSENMFNYYLGLLENNHIYGGPLATTVLDNGNVDKGLGILGFYTSGAATYTIP